MSTPERQRLPQRRERVSAGCCHRWPPTGVTRPDEWCQLSYSRDPDSGRITEVFIDVDDPRNEALANLYRDIAVTISVALQFGADLTALAKATGEGEVNVMGRVSIWPHSPIGTVLRALVAEEAGQ